MEARSNYEDEPSDIPSEIDPEEVKRMEDEAEAERIHEIKVKCSAFDEIETNSFDGLEGGYDEVTVIE